MPPESSLHGIRFFSKQSTDCLYDTNIQLYLENKNIVFNYFLKRGERLAWRRIEMHLRGVQKSAFLLWLATKWIHLWRTTAFLLLITASPTNKKLSPIKTANHRNWERKNAQITAHLLWNILTKQGLILIFLLHLKNTK